MWCVLFRVVLRLLVLAGILVLVDNIVSGIHLAGGFWAYLWNAVLFSVVNMVLGPIFRFVALPFTILTLGLFLLVVNAGLLAITAALSSQLSIQNFGSAVLGGLLIAVFSWLAEAILPLKKRRESSDH